MTAVHDVFLVCDSCQRSSASVNEGASSTWMAREQAKEDGWHFVRRTGRDICDECWDGGLR